MTFLIFLFPFLCFSSNSNDSIRENTFDFNGEKITEILKIYFLDDKNFNNNKQLFQTIGNTFPINSHVIHIKKIKDKTIFEAKYTIGDYGLRVFPKNSSAKKDKNHLIIAGDSMVFGEGCQDNETITAHLSKNLPDYEVLNLGHRGGGPHNTLALFENYPIEKLINQKKGIFMYDFFTQYMFERVIGSKNYVAWDRGQSPYYDLNNNGELERYGNFNDRFFTSLIYKFINSWPWLNKLLPILPRINEHHINIITKVFVKMKKAYLSKFPDGKFFVIINNSSVFNPENSIQILKNNLIKSGIEIIELPFIPLLNETYNFKDGHFNGRGQKLQADAISHHILLN